MTTKNFDEKALYSGGKPIMATIDGALQEATYKDLLSQALSARYRDDDTLSAAELYKRGKLADKIDAGGDVSLEAPEMTMLKDYMAKMWAPRMVATVHDKIEADYIPEQK